MLWHHLRMSHVLPTAADETKLESDFWKACVCVKESVCSTIGILLVQQTERITSLG